MSDITHEQYEAAQHVLNRVGKGGYPGGGFTEKLLDAFAHADTTNTAKLTHAFPTLGEAVMLAKAGADEVLTLRVSEYLKGNN